MATKFSARNSRGEDPRTSKDFEDIIYVLDNRLDIVEEILTAPADVKPYLTEEFSSLLKPQMEEAMSCHLSPFSQEDRLQMLKDKVHKLLG